MKRRILAVIMLTVALISCFSFTPVAQAEEESELINSAEKFSDIEMGKWYKKAVDYVVSHELFSGMTDTKFEPDTAMNRAMFVSVLARVDGAKTSNKQKTKFSDVPSGKWYTGAVKWASDNGIVAGMSETTFQPNTSINREQMCAILSRYAEYKGLELKAVKEKAAFNDDNKISKWAKTSVYKCQQAGIISGMTLYTFAPKNTATRAQVARILYVFHDDFVVPYSQTPPSAPNPETPPSTEQVTPPATEPETPPTIPGVFTNTNGFVPDDANALAISEQTATQLSNYSFDKNPIINRDRQVNREAMPSFVIDNTGFVRDGTKITDLKGKTLTFFTATNHVQWKYRNAKGENIDEWEWFDSLKKEIGLSVKYTVTPAITSVSSAMQSMNAGLACDVIQTCEQNILPALTLSRSITTLVNINNFGSSPGVCKRTMDAYKWGNSLRLVSPIGNVDVLWYNQTLTQELGLSDPHTMWERGVWDWDTYKKYMLSAPPTTKDGRELVAYTHWPSKLASRWSVTNGKNYEELISTANVPTINNNWTDPKVIEALSFISSVNKNVKFYHTPSTEGVTREYMGLYEGTTLMTGTMYPLAYMDTEYSKHIQINWVPYPKSTGDTGKYGCISLGAGMLLPQKTVKEDNVSIALKFMELWATRYTETICDNLNTYEYLNFNYKQRKQYFDFVTQNTVASVYTKHTTVGEIEKALTGDLDADIPSLVNAQLSTINAEMSKTVNPTGEPLDVDDNIVFVQDSFIGGGLYEENEEGDIIETGGHETNEDFVISGTVSNDNGFIPDEENGLEKSERFATEQSKYDFDRNPLINRDRQVNKQALPSFDIDDTGFVRAGTKLADLKGKTLEFFTADNFATWSYRNEKGETIDEWKWFESLQDEIGLKIKYTVSSGQNSVNSALQAMNAGLPCDLIYTNGTVIQQALCISKSITSNVNINNLGSSPGVCKNTMDDCRWGNTLRLIAPIGDVDVLWYNQTLNQELGLSDPHIMWEKGVWNWDYFKKHQLSIPKYTRDGKELVAFVERPENSAFAWPATNGKSLVKIDATASVPTLVNNWADPQVMHGWEFISNVKQSTNAKYTDCSPSFAPEYTGLYEGTTLMSATLYTQVYRDTEYSKHIQINWVPYPKADTATGQEVCISNGHGMLLPKKTAKYANENFALKFMELWATRFTETIFDNLNTFEYYNFNYKQRKQYFDFVTQNVVLSPMMNNFSGVDLQNFYQAISGNAAYNVKTEATKAANLISAYIVESMKINGYDPQTGSTTGGGNSSGSYKPGFASPQNLSLR